MKRHLKLLLPLLLGLITSSSIHGATIVQAIVGSDGNVSVTCHTGESAFTPAGSSEAVTIGEGMSFSSETSVVSATDPSNSFVAASEPADARSEEGKAIAASSAQPSQGSPSDVATAAGEESTAAGTETAAGNNSAPDTQPPPTVQAPAQQGAATPI